MVKTELQQIKRDMSKLAINKYGVFAATEDWLQTIKDKIVTSIEDLDDENYIILTDEQQEAWESQEHDIEYTSEQIFNMSYPTAADVLARKVEAVRKTRSKLYKAESDPLYVEYQKELALGNTEKAEEVKAEWLAKAKEIEDSNPYPTE